MDTTKCRLLLHVIREGSLSAAAQRLGYTPSGVMRAINSLEDEIGFPLLSRTTQGVSLTKEGRAILPLLRDFLRCEERIQQASSRINGIEEGEIVVGAYYSVAANWLPKMIKTFQGHYPHISVHVEEMGNDVLYKNIENHRFDCAITTWRSSAYDWIPLCDDDILFWVPPDHRLAHKKALPLSVLKEESFISPLHGQGTDIERIIKKANISPVIRHSAMDNFTTYRMVEAGLGLSLNNRLMTQSWQGQVKLIPVDPPIHITLGFVVPNVKEASPALKRFMEHVRASVPV